MDLKNAPIKIIKNILSEKDLLELQRLCKIESEKQSDWCNIFNRKHVHNHSSDLIKKLHNDFAQVASEISGFELKPSYTFMSLYGQNGYCPPHFDRIQCQYTLDIEIDSDGKWPIYVKSGEYLLNHNDALCYSGTYHFHYRRKMPQEMSFCHLIFFHFVPKDFVGSLD